MIDYGLIKCYNGSSTGGVFYCAAVRLCLRNNMRRNLYKL